MNELLLKNARIIDPARNIDKVGDIAVANGVIVDAAELKAAPSQFEALRGNYWNRREFSAYTVKNFSPGAKKSLELLGFKTG